MQIIHTAPTEHPVVHLFRLLDATGTPLPRARWQHHSLAELSHMIGSVGITAHPDALELTPDALAEIAHQSPHLCSGLGLPALLTHPIEIKNKSALGLSNFSIDYGLSIADDLFRFDRNGAIITTQGAGGKQFLLPAPIFDLLIAIEDFNHSSERGAEQMIGFQRLGLHDYDAKELKRMGQLARIRIDYADRVGLDIDHATCDFAPRLLCTQHSNIDGYEEASPPQDVLANELQREFVQKHSKSPDASKYKFGNEHFVFVSPRVKRALGKIHEIQRDPEESRRIAFILNPHVELEDNEAIEDEQESVFAETEAYSARVRELGVWVPKSGVFRPASGIKWFEPETIGVMINGRCVIIPTEELSGLTAQAEDALQNGDDTITISGESVPLNEEVIAALRDAARVEKTPQSQTGEAGEASGAGGSRQFRTNNDEWVHNKEEQHIANALNEVGMVYAYEKKLCAGGQCYFPDFTIPYLTAAEDSKGMVTSTIETE